MKALAPHLTVPLEGLALPQRRGGGEQQSLYFLVARLVRAARSVNKMRRQSTCHPVTISAVQHPAAKAARRAAPPDLRSPHLL